jgi:hypothetical protein
MRSCVRFSFLALLVGVIVAVSAPAAQGAFGVSKFEALDCKENAPEGEPKECSAKTPGQFFIQAAGHPNVGITDFTFNELGTAGNGVKSIRTDLPVGFSTNPQALPQCNPVDFNANFFKVEANHCNSNTESGKQEITIVLPGPTLVTLTGTVYNLNPPPGLPLESGIDIALPFLGGKHVHSLIEGGVSWHKEAEATEEGIESGDYHEFFKTKIAKSLTEGEAPLVRSRLVTNGVAGSGLLTRMTTCPGPHATHLRVEPYVGSAVTASFTTTATSEEENCGVLKFEPTFALSPSSTQLDSPDGITTELKFPLNEKSSEIENSDLKNTTVTLPAGLTINPSGAHGLEACTPEQLGIGTEKTTVSCPPRSRIGSAVLNVPGLPPESLTGNIYLGEQSPGSITKPPYKIYVVTESARYGVMVRLEGSVEPNATTGQLTTTFINNPQAPFTNLKLTFDAGPFANLANPLTCGAAPTAATFTPYSGNAPVSLVSEFLVDSNGEKGACPASPPFTFGQSAAAEPSQGGANSTFTMTYERSDGNQYFGKIRTVLPAGVVGIIPSVTPCGESQASLGSCTSASQIGTVMVAAGAGSHPFSFPGKVYLTGPFEGAPYGLSIVVPATAGPFELGNVIARVKIEVDPHSARVILTDNAVPTIVGGIPSRIKSIAVSINRQGFQRNPTNCGVLLTESTLTGTLGTTSSVSTPFQAEGCSSLAYKPTFAASTSGKPTKANGASLVTTITQAAGQANFKSVLVTLPNQLPSRLTTLQKACPEATFAANPLSCPSGSNVGTATAVTPVLPGKMTGPAYLVSHGGAAFPDLDIVLEGNGVRIILVGNTDIKKGITTTNFAATPDAPFSSFTLNLPTGPHSALAANGDLCKPTLVMPTTMTAQNGKQVKQNTKITPTGCGIRIVGHKVVGNTAYLTVKTFAAGRISGRGSGLSTARRTLSNAKNATTLKVSLSRRGRSRHRPFRTRVRVGFVPKKKGAHSTASVVVRFR